MAVSKEKIQALLIEKKMTYAKLADESKVSKAQISRIMNADSDSKIRTDTLGKIAKALNVDYKELLADEKGSEN